MTNFKENITDWITYFILTAVLLIPFFGGQYTKHICLSLLISAGLGMGNRIIRELSKLVKSVQNEPETETTEERIMHTNRILFKNKNRNGSVTIPTPKDGDEPKQ